MTNFPLWHTSQPSMWARSVHQLILETSPDFSLLGCHRKSPRITEVASNFSILLTKNLRRPRLVWTMPTVRTVIQFPGGGDTVRWPALFVSWLYLGDCLAILATTLHKLIPAPKDCHGAILYIFFLRK